MRVEYCTIPSGERKSFYKLWFKRAELQKEVESLTAEARRSSTASPKHRARRRKTSWHG